MDNIAESTLKLLKRIKHDSVIKGDGVQFMEYLDSLSRQNYEAWKKQGSDMNDIHKGYAFCIDFLIESFAHCEQEVTISEQDELGQEAFL